MAARSVKATAAKAALLAFKYGGDVIETATLRLGALNGEYDPTTDSMARTWMFDRPDLRVLVYEETDKSKDIGPENWNKAFLFLTQEMGSTLPDLNLTAEVEQDNKVWQIIKAEVDPSKTIAIFRARDFRDLTEAGALVINGLPYVGSILVAAGGAGRYQWQRDGVAIDNERGQFYTVVSGDLGHTITWTDGIDTSPSRDIVDVPPFISPIFKEDFHDGTIGTALTYDAPGYTIVTDAPDGFTYALKWRNPGDNDTAIVTVNIVFSAAGQIRFWRKTSTEAGFDRFRFKIDGVQLRDDSGENPWQGFIYDIPAGTHAFEWHYAKDRDGSGGQDIVWVAGIEAVEGVFS